MNKHWPIGVALILVSIAVGYGMYMQSVLEEKGKVTSEPKALPAHYNPTPIPVVEAPVPAPSMKSPPAEQENEAPAPPERINQAPLKVQQAKPARNWGGNQGGNQGGGPGAGQGAAQGAAARAAAATPTPAGAPAVDHGVIFSALLGNLKKQFDAQLMPINNGFALAVDGARFELDTSPNWSISIYNDNKAEPAVQSANFLQLLGVTAQSLEIDMNATANTSADGKITRRVSSTLGRVVMVTDPAMNNSCTIKPFIRKPAAAAPANGNANAGNAAGAQPTKAQVLPAPVVRQPVQPAKAVSPQRPSPPPSANPVAPPKTPNTEQF